MIRKESEQEDSHLNAKGELGKALQELVQVALLRVREGEVNFLQYPAWRSLVKAEKPTNGAQSIGLKDQVDRRIFMIVDQDIVQDSEGVIKSIGNLFGGLYIYGVELDMEGNPLRHIAGLQLPRNKKEPTSTWPYLLRESSREIVKLTEEIRRASVVSTQEYRAASNVVLSWKP